MIHMNVAVNAAWKHQQAPGIDVLCSVRKIRAEGRDFPVFDADIDQPDVVLRHDPAIPDHKIEGFHHMSCFDEKRRFQVCGRRVLQFDFNCITV